MALPIYTQTVIAMVWDFDKTLIKGYSQDPIFDRFGVDAITFWDEVNSLVGLYKQRNLLVGKDTAYLLHMLTYVKEGIFDGLSNSMLVELGAEIVMSDGIPDFLDQAVNIATDNERYQHHGIELEHYIVSTGIRHLIQGSPIGDKVSGIYANEFVDQPPPPGYKPADHEFPEPEGPIAQVGYMVDNTSKTRAIFEINKGPDVDVNARVDEGDRRIPIRNMIYIADGPSDVPVFSVLNSKNGRCLGVYQDESNYDGVKRLIDDGRVHNIERADFSEGSGAHMWLASTIREIADRICDERESYLGNVTAPAGHVVS